jgi:hypothetical protein
MTRSPMAVKSQLNAAMAAVAPGISAANELCLACVGLLDIDGAAVSMVYEGASWGTFGASSESSRRLDEYQFTFGEGPCLDAVNAREMVLVPDLDAPQEQRWPVFAGAVLDDGIRGVFAFPVMLTSECVGALDLFRAGPGPLDRDQLAGALFAAELASRPLVDLITEAGDTDFHELGEGAASAQLAEMDRIEVYQATGMLIAQLDVDAAEALVRLRAHAIAVGQTASEVALAIVERRLVLDRDDRDGDKDGHGRSLQ